MIKRRRPRVLRPVSPFRKGSIAAATMTDTADEMNGTLPAKVQIVKIVYSMAARGEQNNSDTKIFREPYQNLYAHLHY